MKPGHSCSIQDCSRAGKIISGRRINKGKEYDYFVIGYFVPESTQKKYALIDLRDGAVMALQTKEELAASLNKESFQPSTL